METGEFFCFLIEIDVIPLPVVPEELFCSISSPFMQPYLCFDLVCCHQESLSLPPVARGRPSPAAVCLMPPLTKVYFLDNMSLFEATFLPLRRKKERKSPFPVLLFIFSYFPPFFPCFFFSFLFSWQIGVGLWAANPGATPGYYSTVPTSPRPRSRSRSSVPSTSPMEYLGGQTGPADLYILFLSPRFAASFLDKRRE